MSIIEKNLLKVRKEIGDKELTLMVKANAYNHGVEGVTYIANTIVDRYGVATLDEAIHLRNLGVEKPITLFLFEDKDIKDVINYQITPIVYNENTLCSVIYFNYHNFDIKIDTGMNRYGFKTIIEVSNALDHMIKINMIPRAIHTHFSSEQSVFEQKECFDKLLESYSNRLNNTKKIVSASSGIRKGLFLDGVRLGLDAYINALEVSADIISIKNVKANEEVGYDGLYKPIRDTRIAVITGGYYDGIRRSYRGARALINGKECTIVGNVCMDSTLLDIGDIPAKVGDRVVILNSYTMPSYINIDKSSAYEVITAIKGRGKRIYLYNGQIYNKIIN